MAPIPPGSTIGILGGGQLGRMTAMAAARLGYRCHIFCPDADSPAFQVAAAHTIAAYEDEAALEGFARAIDVATLEFENIPVASLAYLEQRVAVRPRPAILDITQHRLREKDFLRAIGIGTADYRSIAGAGELEAAAKALGRPAILKSAMFGYDGKGQVAIGAATKPQEAWRAMGGSEGILEAFVDFAAEISVIAARGADGTIACYDPVENRHVRHILDTSIAPARLSPQLKDEAVAIARRIAEALELVGLVAVEMFLTRDERLLVNELAPRPHNSGHWTIDACAVSQFEQFVRAVCGLPLGAPARHSDTVMKNLLGDEIARWPELLAQPGICLHLYGKSEARAGRKMGHFTRLWPLGGLPATI
jgi:5-(carboxyamino)imidazole ribonucleotide synthase